MKQITIAAALFAACFTTSAVAQEQPFFCSMTSAEAAKSSNCLRYYVECNSGPKNSGFVSPVFQNMPAEDIINIGIESGLVMAARNCHTFSYQEAAAALEIHRVRSVK